VGRFACVTMSVQQLQIVVALIPALGFWNDMIDFEGIMLREVQPTCAAASLLFAQVPCHAEADGRMTGRDRNTARATLGRSLAVSAFPRYVPV
jgi:hypothetical protein